jgi:uncharacterized membrane protein YfcA
MRTVELDLPEIGLIAATRGMLGAGIGLLLAEKLDAEPRRAVGWALLAVGLVTTVPLVLHVAGKASRYAREAAR